MQDTIFSLLSYPKQGKTEAPTTLNTLTRKKASKKRESYYRDKLAFEEDGTTEVIIEIGQIDVVTKDYVIEVKFLKLWTHALGQVLGYSHYFPELLPRLHLILEREESIPDYVFNICNKYDVLITYEYEPEFEDEVVKPDIDLMFGREKKLLRKINTELFYKVIAKLTETGEDKEINIKFLLAAFNSLEWVKDFHGLVHRFDMVRRNIPIGGYCFKFFSDKFPQGRFVSVRNYTTGKGLNKFLDSYKGSL